MNEDERLLEIPIPANPQRHFWTPQDVQMYYMQQRIKALRGGLEHLFQDGHDGGEWSCPDDQGRCFCGADARNAWIDFVLDPSQPLELYARARAQESARMKYSELLGYKDHMENLPKDHHSQRFYAERGKRELDAQIARLLEAQPWLREESDNDGQ